MVLLKSLQIIFANVFPPTVAPTSSWQDVVRKIFWYTKLHPVYFSLCRRQQLCFCLKNKEQQCTEVTVTHLKLARWTKLRFCTTSTEWHIKLCTLFFWCIDTIWYTLSKSLTLSCFTLRSSFTLSSRPTLRLSCLSFTVRLRETFGIWYYFRSKYVKFLSHHLAFKRCILGRKM